MTTRKISEILTEAYKLIRKPEQWTQNVPATAADGCCVSPASPEAVSWCSYGAIEKVLNRGPNDAAIHVAQALTELRDAVPGRRFGIIDYNDKYSHPSVMKVWRKAIKAAKAKEAEAELLAND